MGFNLRQILHLDLVIESATVEVIMRGRVTSYLSGSWTFLNLKERVRPD